MCNQSFISLSSINYCFSTTINLLTSQKRSSLGAWTKGFGGVTNNNYF